MDEAMKRMRGPYRSRYRFDPTDLDRLFEGIGIRDPSAGARATEGRRGLAAFTDLTVCGASNFTASMVDSFRVTGGGAGFLKTDVAAVVLCLRTTAGAFVYSGCRLVGVAGGETIFGADGRRLLVAESLSKTFCLDPFRGCLGCWPLGVTVVKLDVDFARLVAPMALEFCALLLIGLLTLFDPDDSFSAIVETENLPNCDRGTVPTEDRLLVDVAKRRDVFKLRWALYGEFVVAGVTRL